MGSSHKGKVPREEMLFRAIGLVQNQDSWQAHSRSEHGASALFGLEGRSGVAVP